MIRGGRLVEAVVAEEGWVSRARLRGPKEGQRSGRLTLQARLTHYEGLHGLWFVRKDSEERLFRLAKELAELGLAGGLQPFRKPEKELRAGLLLVADCGPELGLHRALVLSVDGELSVEVRCVDWGGRLFLPPTALFRLTEALAATPRLARRLHLWGWDAAGLVLDSEGQLAEFVESFCDVDGLDDVELGVDLMGEDEEGVMHASIYRQGAEGGPWEPLDLALELLSLGLVRHADTPPPQASPEESQPQIQEQNHREEQPNDQVDQQPWWQRREQGRGREQPVYPQSRRRLWVGGLYEGVTAQVLYEHFSAFGRLRDWHVVRDREGPRFAFLTFEEEAGLEAALAAAPHVLPVGDTPPVVFVRPADIRNEVEMEDEGPARDPGQVRSLFVDHCGALSEKELKEHFSQFARVVRVNRRHGKTFAFVDYSSPEGVEAALAPGAGQAVAGTAVFLKVRKAAEKSRELVRDAGDYEDLPWYVRGLQGPDGRGPTEGAEGAGGRAQGQTNGGMASLLQRFRPQGEVGERAAEGLVAYAVREETGRDKDAAFVRPARGNSFA